MNGTESADSVVPSDIIDIYTVTASVDGLLQVGDAGRDLRVGVTLLIPTGGRVGAKDAEGKESILGLSTAI